MNQASDSNQNKPAATQPQEQSNWPFIVRLLVIAAITVVVVYGVWWGALYTMQDKLIFPVDQVPKPASRQPRFANTLVLTLELEDGGKNEAWLIPGRGVTQANPAPLVVFFHGNAEIIDLQDQIVNEYTKRGINVLLPEYRGYGRSSGNPGLVTIDEDCKQFYDTVIKLPIVDPTKIVFHGRSIGGAVAGQLAITRQPAGLILESTLANMAKMATDRAAPGFLVKHKYITDQVVAKLKCPQLIMHGSVDDIIPVDHGHLLQQANPNATYVEFDAGHNDFPGMNNLPAYWSQIDKLLGEVGIDPTVKPLPKAANPAAEATAPQTATPAESTPAK
ncbi:MAG TPA: hypothetical protein DCM28_21340 [Phycisphaerales bacterium]|nr:hypothetical protein [Phycisphaerales bacterium]HCD34979.1 hypothetical protein [Phycisphaerales bacterium]|tara:strand:+ start:30116 stop:31114 length:999 start_codon:yes stop_codon:yes gene_type:complete